MRAAVTSTWGAIELRDRPVAHGVLPQDGHVTDSPDRRWLLTDEYRNHADGRQPPLLYDLSNDVCYERGRFAAPLRDELRCDRHRRWSRDGRSVCSDSAHEGRRNSYVIDVAGLV
ncbi:MAG: hypothetical protein AAF800_14200 [Planctomycetota bacterium]